MSSGVVVSVDENRVLVLSHEGGPDSTHRVDEKAYVWLNKVPIRLDELLAGDAVTYSDDEPIITIEATRDPSVAAAKAEEDEAKVEDAPKATSAPKATATHKAKSKAG